LAAAKRQHLASGTKVPCYGLVRKRLKGSVVSL
jgi:hypothetical protein